MDDNEQIGFHSEEHHSLYRTSNINQLTLIYKIKIGWTRSENGRRQESFQNFIGLATKKTIGIPRHRWEDKDRIDNKKQISVRETGLIGLRMRIIREHVRMQN